MTFLELKQQVKDYCGLTSPEADTRIGRSINRHYRRVTSSLGMDTSRFTTISQVTTTLTRAVTFAEIEKIDRVLDGTTASSIHELEEVSIAELRKIPVVDSAPSQWAVQNTDADSVTIIMDTAPTAVYTLKADGWVTLADLSGNSEPIFPESFHDILAWGVIAEELLRKEKPQLAVAYEQKAEKLLSDLRFHLADSPTRVTRQAKASA